LPTLKIDEKETDQLENFINKKVLVELELDQVDLLLEENDE
jgi:hypothetical protein